MKKFLYMAVAVIAALSSCQSDNDIASGENGTGNNNVNAPIFTATIESNATTRTTLSDGSATGNKKVSWLSTDKVFIYGCNITNNGKDLYPKLPSLIGEYSVAPGETDATSATLTAGTLDCNTGGTMNSIFAIYPSSFSFLQNNKGYITNPTGDISDNDALKGMMLSSYATALNLPATQTYAGNDMSGIAPMAASYIQTYTDGTQLQFKNLTALLAITVENSDFSSVSQIEVTTDKQMNYLFSLDNKGELVAKITGDDLTDAYKTVTLDCQNATIDNTKTFYISVPANTYGKLVIDVTGNSVTKTMTASAASIEVVRNKIYPITFAEDLYVDLGLPSHTLWAKKNIGAGSPTDQGLYYAWGDTRGYAANAFDPEDENEYYDFENYPDDLFEKYDEDGGTWEGSNIDPNDDTATKLWGSKWCMPTIEQFEELVNATNTTITKQEDGWLITSKTNGNSIYFPKTGYFDDEEKSPSESGICWLWTSIWWSEDEYAWAESFFIKNENNAVKKGTHNKYIEVAMPIRPVMK